MTMDDSQKILLVIYAIILIQVIIIICFFVLCDNVAKIKSHLIQKDDFKSKFIFLMSIGEKEKAREILINRILANNNIFVKGHLTSIRKINLCFKTYAEEFQALGIKNPLPEDIVKELS